MEKLIELLNEYEKEVKKSEFYEWEKGIGGDTNLFRRDTRDEEGSHLYSDTADTYVISKKYGFIKRLVENDKIDKRKIDTRLVRNVESHYDEDGYWVENSYEDYSDTDTILMLLSISSSSIDDLISYLK